MPKVKQKREYIALYRSHGEWRLITREVATLSHATKMQKRYEASYFTKLIKVT
jgi:hypothetical protein